MATTPNLGLTIPQAGIVGVGTPGATNNTTPGTYPYIEAGNLNLIDSGAYSLNNPVPTAGININADLPLNNHSLTGAKRFVGAQLAQNTTGVSISGSTGFTTPVKATGSGDMAGYVSFTGVAHGYNAGDTLFTITYGTAFPTSSFINIFTVNLNATANLDGGFYVASSNSTGATIAAVYSFSTTAVTYGFGWMVVGV